MSISTELSVDLSKTCRSCLNSNGIADLIPINWKIVKPNEDKTVLIKDMFDIFKNSEDVSIKQSKNSLKM